MSDILIRCPIAGVSVQTGLSTETIVFRSLQDHTAPYVQRVDSYPVVLADGRFWLQRQADVPFRGVKRASRGLAVMSAFDPKRT
jgi:hypothetical protein